MNNKYNWQLYHWHLEPSSKCSLKCPRCPRQEHPDISWIGKEISIDQFKKTFTDDVLSHVKRFTMCGDVGDPIYCKDFLKIIKHIKSFNREIEIFTITNGSYKTQQWWNDFASLSNKHDTINFSVDGFDQYSNDLYRVNSNWQSVMDGMSICAKQSEMFVNWAMIVFKFNQDHIDQVKMLATTQGCDALQITYSTKFGSKYGEAYGGDNDALEPDTKYIAKSHRYERHTINLSGRIPTRIDYLKENYKKYLQVAKQYSGEIIPMCLIGNRGLYLNAEGSIFPCSWTSFPYKSLEANKKTILWNDSFFVKYKKQLNVNNNRSLEQVLNDDLWQKLFDSFDHKDKNWVECLQKCNRHVVDKHYAIGYYTN